MTDLLAGGDAELARALSPFLREAIGAGQVTDVRMLAGGKSNLTLLVRAGGRDLVMRMPPPTAHGSGHDVLREYRFLTALEHAPVPTPVPVAACEDASVAGAPFYLMERLDGRVLMSGADLPAGTSPDDLSRFVDGLVDTMVALHALDPAEWGLGEVGSPQGFAERQARRWTGQWLADQTRPIPALDEIAGRILAAVDGGRVRLDWPTPTITHGDFNAANVLVADDDIGRVSGLLDWEMATRGNPLMDLGLMMAYNSPYMGGIFEVDDPIAALPGFPPPEAIAERYAARSGADVGDIRFFVTLALFKVMVIIEDLRRRVRAGTASGEGLDAMGTSVPAMAESLLASLRD